MFDKFKNAVVNGKVALVGLGTVMTSSGLVYLLTPKDYGAGSALGVGVLISVVAVAVRGLADCLTEK